ncbi:MAG: glycosyltransferase [Patescibacteria group bacterium]
MISVVIPAYNHASSLARCLESLFAQEDVQVEIIVVNDGSTDGTRAVLLPFQDRITTVHQENAGANVARNRGAKRAQGAFLLFVDADATFERRALWHLRRALESHPEIGFAYSDFYFGFKHFRTGPFDERQLRRMNFIHISALMRRELFVEFDESMRRFQDWDLWLTFLKQGIRGLYVPKTLMRVTVERTGISSWLPKWSYHAPWKWLPGVRRRVQAYEQAREVLIKKHDL